MVLKKKSVKKDDEELKEKDKILKAVHPSHPKVQDKINKSLKLSIKEGSYAAATSGFGVSYFVPYTLAMGASPSQIGFLSSLVSLVPSLVQLKSSRLIEKFSRKKIVHYSTIIQNLMLIPIILVALLFLFGFSYTVWVLIGLLVLFYSIGAVTGPAWFSWIGSLVPEKERGKYFSRRNRITGFFALLTLIIGGFVLDKFELLGELSFNGKVVPMVFFGFVLIFFLAFVSRIISIRLLKKQYEPKLKIHKQDYFSLKAFLRKARKTPFGRFTIFTGLMRIAGNISAPFFAVYILSEMHLGLSYSLFMIITVAGTLSHLLFLPIIGKVSDRFGNVRLLRISCFLISLVPFFWLITIFLKLNLTMLIIYLIFVPQLIGGIGWAGYLLATNNYIYDSVRQEKRGIGLAYFNLLGGIGLFIGAGIGALFALTDFNLFGNNLLFIFLISGVARLTMCLFAGKYLREVRHVKKFSSQFVINEFHPSRGIIREIHKFNHFGSKVIHSI